MSVLDRNLLIVTGKGGTGKTTTAAALAKIAAWQGKKVLLCEIDTSGDIASAFDNKTPTFEPREVQPNLFVMRMDTEDALAEYMRLNLKIPIAIRLGPFAKAFDFVATAAPGVREVLTIGKLCWEVKRQNYDIVIADAPASGHIVAQIQSPQSIGGLVTSGPLDRQTSWMNEMLTDPDRTGAVIVTTAEEVPISESVELMARLDTETQTPIAAVVINRTLPELFVRNDEEIFNDMAASGNVDVNVVEVTKLGLALRRSQVKHLDALFAAVNPLTPLLFVPQVFKTLQAPLVVDAMTEALSGEL